MNARVGANLVQQTAASQLTAAVIREASETARREDRRVTDVLQDTLALPPTALVQALGTLLHFAVIDLAAMSKMAGAFDLLSFAEALSRGCVVLRDGVEPVLVIADPFDHALRAWCVERIGPLVDVRLAHRDDIAAFLARQEETLRAIDTALPAAVVGNSDETLSAGLSLRSIEEDTSAIVKLVNSTLYDGLKSAASDLHFESHATGLTIKYRLDGALTQVGSIEGRDTAEQVLSRLKVMSELDIAERRVPQDGRFRVRALGRDVDFRVSVMPCIHGEDAVVRILDKQSLAESAAGLRLDRLGFDATTIASFRRLTRDPYGLILVTGPTGSGKTTSLYACLSEINNGHDKIITIEDPVEYQLPGILQIPVNEKKGLTFARGLRSILRHDPDRIMVGEIRDAETAQIAIQAALTGHLVLSSVHANNSLDVIGRFTHMDVDPYSFVSALTGVLAQRLVRINCVHCSVAFTPEAAALDEAQVAHSAIEGRALQAGRGCARCRGSGYKGRSAIGELLLMDDALRELIVARAPLRRIKEVARANGTAFLREAALRLFFEGQTTLDEVNRVTLVA